MCTLALYFRVLDDYPLIIAANRDEQYDRPSMAPHLWQTSPMIVAGKDLLAGGTWLGVNEHGLMTAILNRRADTEPQPARSSRSRGLFCLDLLGLKTAAQGIEFVRSHSERYQPLTLVFADVTQAWVVYNPRQELKASRLPEGLHVFSNTGQLESEKVSRAHRRFAQLADSRRSNVQEASDWPEALAPILGDHAVGNGSVDPKDAICVHGGASGTVSSSIILCSRSERQVKTFFCPGPPCRASFGEALALDIL